MEKKNLQKFSCELIGLNTNQSLQEMLLNVSVVIFLIHHECIQESAGKKANPNQVQTPHRTRQMFHPETI